MYAFTKYLCDHFPFFSRFRKALNDAVENVILSIDPLFFAKREFRNVFKRDMNLKSPRNVVEKFYWIECNADLSLISRCADKEAVRGFVEERGCGELLNTLYAKWDSPDDISFDILPESFILKSNNGSGDALIVNDKSKMDENQVREYFALQLKKNYGKHNAQLHYCQIKPCIIAEKLLPVGNVPCGDSLVDYKVWCFDGKPTYFFVVYNRTKEQAYISLFDTDWNECPEFIKPDRHYKFHPEIKIPRPESLSEMLKAASLLSKGFPEVRVDFYEVDGKPVFGEMTFTSAYTYFTDDFYTLLGDMTDLSILGDSGRV